EVARITSVLTDYFQTHVNLHDNYQRWSALDTNFRAKALCFPGVRVLAQDPWENLVSFICSANNHIKRITSMVDQLATHFGQHVADYGGYAFYCFPTVSELAHPNLEAQLRQLGFGYRAKYIHQTVQHLQLKHGKQATRWLQSLRQAPYSEARAELLQLAGIGPKVADCICLMSLDKPEAIPVDTHVWQIARRDYAFRHSHVGTRKSYKDKGGFSDRPKTLSKGEYEAVGDHFRKTFGAYAGWAHSAIAHSALPSP
ncbi:8-oxoguanine glycosylase ogg1, partial [Dimargaris verticillata]